MEIKGQYFVPASREKVWEALNDPDVLRACIPGCDELEQTSPTSFEAKVTAKVGPVRAKFAGEVELTDIVAPESYRISGQGKGGAAGFAKGGARVALAEKDGGTDLTYDVDVVVGGKLAQIGARFIDSTASKMADQFFTKFVEVVSGGGVPAIDAAAAPATASAKPAPAKTANGGGLLNAQSVGMLLAGGAIGLVIGYLVFAP